MESHKQGHKTMLGGGCTGGGSGSDLLLNVMVNKNMTQTAEQNMGAKELNI